MTIGIVIGTFGSDPIWKKLADNAEQSVLAQTVNPDAFVKIHGETLAQARNEGVAKLGTTDALILDADDLLTPDYVEKMGQAKGTLRYPMVGKIYPDGSRELVKYMPCDLLEQNYITIGSMFRVADFLAVGGFGEEPIFEDWSLWLRLWKYGADIQPSQAIYVQNVRPEGRNQGNGVDVFFWYNLIRSRYCNKL
jgi:hypothetical protein